MRLKGQVEELILGRTSNSKCRGQELIFLDCKVRN